MINNICPVCKLDTGISRPRAEVLHLDCALERAVPAHALVRHSHLIELGVSDNIRRQQIIQKAGEAQLDGAFDTVEGGLIWVGHKFGVGPDGKIL